MTAEKIVSRLPMMPHEEGGYWMPTHYQADTEKRPASGSILYYVPRNVKTRFHVIDCDEYWSWHAGSALEIRLLTDREQRVELLGPGEGEQLLVYIPRGTAFAACQMPGSEDGTLVSCITVPRFAEGHSLKLLSEEELEALSPETAAYWREK